MTMLNKFIDGFSISGFRSFGSEVQIFPSLDKINLIIGQNNSGKSNVLRWLQNQYAKVIEACRGKALQSPNGLDRHLGGDTGVFKFHIGLSLSGENYFKWKEDLIQRIEGKANFTHIERIINSNIVTQDNKTAWFKYESEANPHIQISKSYIRELYNSEMLNSREWNQLSSALTRSSGGHLLTHGIPAVINALSPVNQKIPTVTIIPAIREIKSATNGETDFSGIGLIDRLAKLQNPNYNEQHLKEQFEGINRFLQNVTGNHEATLEIPAERHTILIHMDSKTLPLISLGTGIHEVVILAAAATVLTKQIICIEEPEIHLHPTLQRKLVRFLYENTSNQYFIATHSVHLLDSIPASIYHISIQEGQSQVKFVQSPSQRSEICSDLGYKASDIIQSNCIVWVEGPSDRIYIRHWLNNVAPELLEGIHFTIMFYGGRLLSHLSADDPELDDFISLRRMNRNISIIIDSDRNKARQRLNNTKTRVRKEIDSGPGFAWVTKGREIENYIPQSTIDKVINDVHRNVSKVLPSSDFDHRLCYMDSKGKTKTADKVKVAHRVAKEPINFDVLDLKIMVNKLVHFIKDSNEIE